MPMTPLPKPEPSRRCQMTTYLRRALELIADPAADRIGIGAMRIAIAIVFLWIGALKFVPYEADSITPFVANSPVMYFFYKHPEDYKAHLTREGELKPADRAWETANKHLRVLMRTRDC